MADWTNPVLTSQYTALLDILKDRDFDLATMFSPDFSTGTNIPVGAVRWNPTTKIWEIRNVSAGWDPLATKYEIDVDKLDGQHGAYYLAWANLTGVPATFAPSAHTHDDRYYTETEADARYGFTVDNNGNNIRLKAANGTVLSTLQVGYATAAGDAATVAGKAVDQNLRIADSVTFAAVTTTGNTTVEGILQVGKAGGGDSVADFYDATNLTWRSFRWLNTGSKWQVEDATGAFRELFHEGHVPDWSEVAGKPTTFAPTAHGHAFDGTNQLQVRGETQVVNDALTGLLGELVFDTTNKRLYVHDALTLGGEQVAYVSDIPAPQSLTNYARKDIAETFASTLDVTGNFTGAAQVQMLKGRILDTSAAATTKVMLSIEGDSDALQIINYATGDYEIKNPGHSNSIRITDSTAGVQIRTNNATRLIANDTGVEIYGAFLIDGNSVWHAGNDGASSGLDADKLDGLHASSFLQRYSRADRDFNTVSNGIYGIGALSTNVPDALDDGVLVDFFPNTGDVGFQLAADHQGELHFRGGNGANYAGLGAFEPWRKIWHEGNQGTGSGLDADLLDGIQASSFVRNDTSQSLTNTITITGTSTIAGTTWNNGWFRIGTATTGWSMDSNEIYGAGAAIIGTLAGDLTLAPAGNVVIGGSRVLTLADDGTLDAATLDGLDSSQFLRSDTADTGEGLTLASVKVIAANGILWENGVNRITHNDGGGNVQIRFGHEYTTDEVFTHGGTAFYIGGDVDNATGGTLNLKVASNPGGGIGAAVTWGNVLAITASALTWGGDTIWHAGNGGTGSGLDADLLDGLEAAAFMRSNTNTSTTGNLTIDGTTITETLQGKGTQLVINGGDSAGKVAGQTLERVYVNAESGLSINTPDAAHANWEAGYSVNTTIIMGDSITIGGNTAFHDGYHPNADKWTTSRTITLGGNLSGSVSIDGTSNQTLTATITDLGIVTLANKEKSDLTADGHFSFDSSQGLLVYRTQQGTTGAVTVMDGANVDAGSGISITNLGVGDTGTGAFTFSVDTSYLDGIYIKNAGGAVTGSTRATIAEAEAGSNNDQIMTPLRTKQAIDALTVKGLPTLTPGTNIRSRVDTAVNTTSTAWSTRHTFNFIQGGTIRVMHDLKNSGTSGPQTRVRRYRNGAWTTITTHSSTSAYVTKTDDVAVKAGDQVVVQYKGATTGWGKDIQYHSIYIRNVRFKTGGEDLYPGVSALVEGNSV